jgi:transcriptional regulator with XRE-family HTH domain
LLEKSGKSMDKIGLESDISKSTISRILAGKLNPSLNSLQKLADYFEVDPMDLLKP